MNRPAPKKIRLRKLSDPLVVLLILTGATACSRAVEKAEPTSTHCRITDVSGAHSWRYPEDDTGGTMIEVPHKTCHPIFVAI